MHLSSYFNNLPTNTALDGFLCAELEYRNYAKIKHPYQESELCLSYVTIL